MVRRLLKKYRTPHSVETWHKVINPREEFGAVFDAVQLSGTLGDGKTFVDCTPRYSTRKILKKYKKLRSGKTLAEFVESHFDMPEAIESSMHLIGTGNVGSKDVREHIEALWTFLTRGPDDMQRSSSLLPLPHRYVVPGGRFREIYYWDSYFTMLGLRESGRFDLMEDMVRNFAHLIHTYGLIPNGNRSYYLTRSQPPVFALMVELLAQVRGEHVFVDFLPALIKEYSMWMRGMHDERLLHGEVAASEHVVRMPGGEFLNRFWDMSDTPREEMYADDVNVSKLFQGPSEGLYRNIRAAAATGWDFSGRWFADGQRLETIRTTDVVPVDLNSLMVSFEEILAAAYGFAGEAERESEMRERQEHRESAIRRYMWNGEEKWYMDYLISAQDQSPYLSLAGMWPLFSGVALEEQLDGIVETVQAKFLKPGGVVTTLAYTGEQWDAPNGWAPLQYIAVSGLEKYGQSVLAREIAERWARLNISVFERTGALMEKYNVEDLDALGGGGEYPVQDGFGWTNGVLLTFMNKYDIEQPGVDRVEETPEERSLEFIVAESGIHDLPK